MSDVTELEAEAAGLVFARFDHEDAWAIGADLRARALEEHLPIAIDIRTAAGTVLFHVSLPGASADQEHWLRGKAAVVFRFSASSALIAARFAETGAGPNGWLDPNEYAPTGGGVAVTVEGAGVVAAVTVSGLASADDHALAVDAMRRRIRDQLG
ncbi:heme-degrading domain-containing protein [Agromyces silvae]|uniref:heme-degrading domain-containing protein n=1 Tax=Agromyces silvae TaxID=3388266 RepID=UPI00280ABC5D|nr:heme-binding protein [Agromyces protaetiae]